MSSIAVIVFLTTYSYADLYVRLGSFTLTYSVHALARQQIAPIALELMSVTIPYLLALPIVLAVLDASSHAGSHVRLRTTYIR